MCVNGSTAQLEVAKNGKKKARKGTNGVIPIRLRATHQRWEAMFVRWAGWRFIKAHSKRINPGRISGLLDKEFYYALGPVFSIQSESQDEIIDSGFQMFAEVIS
jgi:hypothetical protein